MLTNLNLLPHDSSIMIKDITKKHRYIQLMLHLLKEFQQAIFFFNNKELAYFDAQVGETLCQIRAYKIYLISLYFEHESCKELEIFKDSLQVKIHDLEQSDQHYTALIKLNKKDRPDHTFANVSLLDFFDSLNCVLEIPRDLIFIFLSFILCKYHIVDSDSIPIGINFDAVATRFDISASYSKKIVQFYQKYLSELSCNFIFDLLLDLPQLDHTSKILSWLHFRSDESRMVLPCYLVTEIIITHMIKYEHSAVLVLDIKHQTFQKRVSIKFKGSSDQNNFVLTSFLQDSHKPCVVFAGLASYTDELAVDHVGQLIKKVLFYGLKNLVLINNAAHPQFSGKTLVNYAIDPYMELLANYQNEMSALEINAAEALSKQINSLQRKAQDLGCALNNASLFFLRHIFSDTENQYIKYQLSQELLQEVFQTA